MTASVADTAPPKLASLEDMIALQGGPVCRKPAAQAEWAADTVMRHYRGCGPAAYRAALIDTYTEHVSWQRSHGIRHGIKGTNEAEVAFRLSAGDLTTHESFALTIFIEIHASEA